MPCWGPTRAHVITERLVYFDLGSCEAVIGLGSAIGPRAEDAARLTERNIVTLQHMFEIEHKYTISTRRSALCVDGRIPHLLVQVLA